MKNPRISDEEVSLIKRAKAGDESAFTMLYNKYEKYVTSTALSFVRDMDTAKDLTIQTFVDAYEHLSSFEDYDSFGGWLRTITCRNAIDYIRKEKHYSDDVIKSDDRLSLLNNVSSENELDIVDRVTFSQILDEFDKLPSQHKRICELFYINELTALQVSKKLEIPIGTVKSVLSRIRKRLKNKFKQN